VTTPFPFHLRSGSKVGGDVTCGGHTAATCADCPFDANEDSNGEGWCNGVRYASFIYRITFECKHSRDVIFTRIAVGMLTLASAGM
jgi:hypothetical protein